MGIKKWELKQDTVGLYTQSLGFLDQLDRLASIQL